ncbi:TetR/AcrR family transcriptional regulator [Actinokineospora fastidiosa]|uniref:TetR family transcriptional regulator n=1 Tax=Actinokineospora fastidiosa TaxID=1816 RepID=A0A918GDI7_9PSEU|nr:TetR/AcrR family transcriptional regulator [Actinokineospora fastidiosa]GGS31305.1 TetR family transcriptional regulator [Actinokineospora fastidiosa]
MARPTPTRPRSRPAAGLPAVTPARIIDAAVALTMEHGLEKWTVRQLAAVVQAYPAVVYHHVGSRDAVLAEVLERVVGMLPVPPEELPWRGWFRVLLGELRGLLSRYPGVARRFALHGPGVRAAAPIVDRGVRLLQEAGFGKESVLTYNLLLVTACQFLAMEDDRAANPEARPAENPEQVAGYYASFYDYAIERCLDGAAARLAVLTG